jgi:membrane protein implicated in regulation of membrane protease activity
LELALRRQQRSKNKEILGFVVALLGAAFAALDLHGWHMYMMLGVTAVVAIVAAIFLARKLRRPLQSETQDAEAAKSRGD